MKKQSIKSALTLLAVVAATALLSSCNRGYGCPNNFSLNDNVFEVVGSVLNLIF